MKKILFIKNKQLHRSILTFYNDQEISVFTFDHLANNMRDMRQALAADLKSKDHFLINYWGNGTE